MASEAPATQSDESLSPDEHESDSSMSSSSSDEEDVPSDSERDEDLGKLQAILVNNPYDFHGHVEYINALRRKCELEKLRSAREHMSSIFPLTPGMWREWAHDEARLLSSDQDIDAVENLYERGLKDYLSIPLWLDYLEFKRSHDKDVQQCNSEGVSKMRDLYERALASASLHFTEGFKIWRVYRLFEMDILDKISDSTDESKEKQSNRVRNLYRRQLSVPLCDIKSTLREYTEWESQHAEKIGDDQNDLALLPSHTAAAYKKAIEMCSLREPMEEKIAEDKQKDAEFLLNYLTYIALEDATGDPARVQVIYERAVADFPVTHDLWLKYTGYLEKKLKGSKIILDVYGRAVRNCPWVQTLWSRYLLAIERSNSDEQELAKVFEQSLNSGFPFSAPEEYLDHYLTRVEGIRRQINRGTNEDKKQCYLETLRETCAQADQFFCSYFPGFKERTLKLHSYWAWLEASLAKNIAGARSVFENLVKSSGSMAEIWKEYIAMEIRFGNLAEARTIYKRCYSRRLAGNGSEELCDAWLRFEREYGSLEDYDFAVMKIMPRLEEVKHLRLQEAEKHSTVAGAGAQESEKGTKKAAKKKRDAKETDDSSNKRPRITDVKAVPMDLDQEKPVGGEPKMHVEAEVREKTWYTDRCTAFISRLASTVNEEDLRNFFADCGTLKDVRLMKDRKTGMSRCFAYLDFENEEGLQAAIAKDNSKMKGSKIRVFRSNPSLAAKKGGAAGWRNNDGAAAQDDDDANVHERNREHVREMGNATHRGGQDKDASSRGRGRGRGGRSNVVSHRRGGHLQLTGRNTFAAPRSVVRPLGFSEKTKTDARQDEGPKSNEDFRKMLLKE